MVGYRSCENCKHLDKVFDEEPCCSCEFRSNWEPKDDAVVVREEKEENESMTVKEMIQRLRTNELIEIRVNNYMTIRVNKNNTDFVKEDLLSKEVYDWGVDRGTVFINVKEE